MAKKVVASLKNKSGIKYAKLVRSVKSDKTGAYKFKEEIVIEKYVNEILAGKSPQQVIDELREKGSLDGNLEKLISDLISKVVKLFKL